MRRPLMPFSALMWGKKELEKKETLGRRGGGEKSRELAGEPPDSSRYLAN